MNALENNAIPADVMADLEAACKALAEGGVKDPATLRRMQERAAKVRGEVFQKHGALDIGVPAIRELRDGDNA